MARAVATVVGMGVAVMAVVKAVATEVVVTAVAKVVATAKAKKAAVLVVAMMAREVLSMEVVTAALARAVVVQVVVRVLAKEADTMATVTREVRLEVAKVAWETVAEGTMAAMRVAAMEGERVVVAKEGGVRVVVKVEVEKAEATAKD